MRAFRNFVRSYMQHLPNRAKLLSELSAFLTYTPDKFAIHNAADSLSVAEFFRKLNEILLADEVNCDFHWTAFRVIDIAANNSETRQYLVDTVRIVTGIANYAVKGSSSLTEEKQIQVWSLVDRITTGMAIITEEPHLTNLIDYLVTSVKRTDLCRDIKMLQVSILTNLCFKNEVAVACLLRFTKSKELLGAIEEHKVFWGKMSMALARFDATMLEFELHFNLKMIFSGEYLNQLMRNNDQRLLRNVLDMLVVGFERDEHSKQTMQHFDFKESIEAVLTLIDDSEISFQSFELMNVFLGIVNSILSASNTTLESSIPRLFKLIVDNTNTTNILSEAIKTIRLIASTVADSQHLIPFIVLLIDNLSSHQDNVPVTTEVYQLLIEINAKHPTVISQLPQEIIVKSIDPDTWSHKLTDVNFPMQIRRLQWLLTYTNMNDNDILRRKVTDIMRKKEVHQIFASGLKSSDEEMCTLTMELIKSPLFPVKSVSKILSGTFTPSIPNDERDCQPPVEIVRPHFSASLETRLNNEVDRLKSRTENSKFGMNDYISMLEYQNSVANAKEENLKLQIKSLSDLSSIQSNEIGGLKLTIRNCLNKISELESKLENSKLCADSMKTAYSTIKVKYDNGTKKLQDLTNMYKSLHNESEALVTAKTQQIAELTIQCEKDRETHAATLAQLKKDVEREKLELEEQLAKQVKGLKENYTRKEKELKDAHEQDLQKYSAKRSAMKKTFEQEKAELLKAHKKETQAALDKIENLEKELATKIDQIKENAQAITETTAFLDEANSQVKHYKDLYEQIRSLLNPK